MKLKIQARAKINWTLDLVGTLPNGYHDLDMLMQSVTLCDQMTMEEAPQLTLYVRAQGRSFVPADGNNLVLKAAAALQAATGCTRGARITLKKYIPVAAGMGGAHGILLHSHESSVIVRFGIGIPVLQRVQTVVVFL